MRKVHVVTRARLNSAYRAVARELAQHGLWNSDLAAVEVRLVPLAFCYGWQAYGATGEIGIPRLSASRLQDFCYGRYTTLRDVLRHEYGHAVAYVRPGLFRSQAFRIAFGAAHDSDTGDVYSPDHHVSAYAATDPSEDFAETFMFYLRHRGKLPPWYSTPAISRKWRFIRRLCRTIRTGARTF